MLELAGYETLEEVGEGGFGTVWLARQLSTGRQVAVKLARAPIEDKNRQIRFEQEYRSLGLLSGHPNIVDIVTAGKLEDGRAYLVLEYIDGGTLWHLAQKAKIDEIRLTRIGRELLNALTTAHQAGVLHRDVKPENVLLRSTGETVLSDFGLAQLVDQTETSPLSIAASVAYAAPETLRGDAASEATDMYGIGVCLLTGALRNVPFVDLKDQSIQSVINRVRTEDPPDLAPLGFSALFTTTVHQLLAKDPSRRLADEDLLRERFNQIEEQSTEAVFSWDHMLPSSKPSTKPPNKVATTTETDSPPPAKDHKSQETQNSTGDEVDEIDRLLMELTDDDAYTEPVSGIETPDPATVEAGDAQTTSNRRSTDEPHTTDKEPTVEIQAIAFNEKTQRLDAIAEHIEHGERQPTDASNWDHLNVDQLSGPTSPDRSETHKPESDREETDFSHLEAGVDPTKLSPAMAELLGETPLPVRDRPPMPTPTDEQVSSADVRPAVQIGEREKPAPTQRELTPTTDLVNHRPRKRKRQLLRTVFILVVAFVATSAIGTAVIFLFNQSAVTDASPNQTPPTIELPLDLASSDLGPNAIEVNTPSLGPNSVGFCGSMLDAPAPSGWKGSQFLSQDRARSIEQIVVVFAQPEKAFEYVAAIEASLDCNGWEQQTEGQAVTSNASVLSRTDEVTRYETQSTGQRGQTVALSHVTASDDTVLIVEVVAPTAEEAAELESAAEAAIAAFDA